MLIGIIGGDSRAKDDRALEALDQKLEELIESSQCFLFHAAVLSNAPQNETLGCRWASRRGCPLRVMDIDRILKKADYVIFILTEEDKVTKEALMKYKMSGKHGSVIRI